MKADIKNIKEGIKSSHRKNNGYYGGSILIGVKKGEFKELADLRFYAPGQSNCYSCLWIHGDEIWGNGSGVAGGFGYHKRSAAAEEAFNSAGISFDKHWGGSGDGAVKEALLALGKALGYSKLHVIEAHA